MDRNIIQKKQYINRTDLTEFIVPYGIEEIEEYAFAQCGSLLRIAIPDTAERIAANAFFECDSLDKVYVYHSEGGVNIYSINDEKTEALATLTAIAFRELSEASLFDVRAFGNEEWIKIWDNAFMAYLLYPDDAGFMPFLAGGEEDYEEEQASRDSFAVKTRTKKAACLIDRLLAEEFFSLDDKLKMRYLNKLKSLCETGSKEALSALASRKDNLEKTVELFASNHLLTDATISELISALPSEAVELKGLLMRTQEGNIFESLKL